MTRKRDQGWTGAWQLAFVDPASTGKGTARSNIRLYGDLRPAWLNQASAPLTSGSSTSLQLGLTRVDNTPVAPGTLKGTVSIGAELDYADGTVVPIAAGLHAPQLAKPVVLSLSGAPAGKAKVRLTLTLTTASAGNVSGTTLEPQAVDYPVTVMPPPNYPRLPATVSFGAGETVEPVTAELPLAGPGCAWLQSSEASTLPNGVTAAPVTADASSPRTCRTGKLTLTLTPDHVGSGLASGLLHVMTRSDQAAAQPMPVTIRYSYEMQRPLNQKVLWLMLVGLMLLGLTIPLLILLLVKWVNSKIPGSTLTTLSHSGQVSGGSSFLNGWRPDTGQLHPRALEATDRRRVQITPRTVLRAKANWLKLTEPGYVVVDSTPFVASTGSRLPLAVQDQWVAVIDPANPHHGPVEVVFLLSSGARRLDELVSDARAKVPAAIAELRRGLGAAPPPPSAGRDEWGAAASPSPSARALASPARPAPTRGDPEEETSKVKKYLIIGVGGSGGATLRYLMDQLREDLRGHGIDHLPDAWQFLQIDVNPTPEQTPGSAASPTSAADTSPSAPQATPSATCAGPSKPGWPKREPPAPSPLGNQAVTPTTCRSRPVPDSSARSDGCSRSPGSRRSRRRCNRRGRRSSAPRPGATCRQRCATRDPTTLPA